MFTLFFLPGLVVSAQSNITYGMGNYKGVNVTSSSNDSTGIVTLMESGFLPNLNSASRFLAQATFGANYDTIVSVANNGFEDWIDQQLAMPINFSLYDYVAQIHQNRVDSLNVTDSDCMGPEGPCTIYNVSAREWYFDVAWFQAAMTQPDQLRHRVALALSEIFVISRESVFDDNPYAFAKYYDMLLEHAYGNYRSLIDSITYSPSMAVYLTFMNNPATDTLNGNNIFPDQNYAREIMQLFSIGLFQLNVDGTEIVDSTGSPIPTYTNADIEGLSGIFTGLTWGDSHQFPAEDEDYWSYVKRLKFYTLNEELNPAHELGPKNFLGTSVNRPAGQEELEIQDALDHIFNHQNVGPFIVRRLIQRLVTSNPSHDYIGRVAQIFNDNGQGVRGDLGAVVKAILLDPEARSCDNQMENSFGMLREPFWRYMHLLKGMNLQSPTNTFRNAMERIFESTDQKPMYSPTVFNFFMPDYSPTGVVQDSGLVAPEFQITNAQTLVGYLNLWNDYINRNEDVVDYNSYFSGESFKQDEEPQIDYTQFTQWAQDEYLPFLLDRLNLLFAHGRLSQAALTEIENAIKLFPSEDMYDEIDRVRLAVFLVMASPDYLIFR